ncbi:helix-turn-helix transcriptional regulator [Nitrospira sp. CMX1]
MKPLTLAEAAQFLRMSRSSLYQRKDIPRYRRPGSRVMLFDQEELEAWLKQGRMGGSIDEGALVPEPQMVQSHTEGRPEVMDIQVGRVYHRNARYR